jgi:tRNA-dihydrouridine synthase 3
MSRVIVLDAPGKLSKILVGMNRALGDIPLTVKLRTGVKEGKNTAHKLMPRLAVETGIAAMTVPFAIFSLAEGLLTKKKKTL